MLGRLVVPHNGKELPGFDEWDWEGKLLGQQHDEELPNLEKSKGFTRDPVRVVCCRGIWYGCWGGGKWRRGALASASSLSGLPKEVQNHEEKDTKSKKLQMIRCSILKQVFKPPRSSGKPATFLA
jgi:hypothetical protein